MNKNSSRNNNKNIFNHHFTLPILAKIHAGFRPSQIADQLGVAPQDIYYHTNRMINADLILKDTSNGIKWTLSYKGTFVLKHKATGSVNSLLIIIKQNQ